MSAYSKKAVAAIEPLVLEKVNILVRRFRQAHDENAVLVLDAAFAALTADIISEYSFGSCLNYLEDESFNNEIRESLMASLSLFHVVRFFPAIMMLAKVLPVPLVRLLNPNLCKVLDLRRLIRELTMRELGKMSSGLPSQAMLVKRLNDPSIPECERSLERLCDEGFVFLNAGVTAGKTLAFIMFRLLSHGGVTYSKLFDELERAFPDVGALDHVTEKDLVALPYLRGVVYEGLRLSIGPLTRLPRVAPDTALLFQGQVIPPGTGISESNYFLHMNEELFPCPTQFRPERWAEANKNGKRLENYIVTFSKGTRHCLGMNLAYMELYMLVAVLVRRFHMELYQTTDKDVEIFRDKLFGYPREPSLGVRIRVSACRS
ncbi:Cytochrome P450 [Cordyceps fumosorosea ARSEF 2679]|uniref:Cytochrome P450 n=1 Tax=Cordyceps fumosorosea (strain ARSEF 2679) TaxID=1081104 RepID=A0A167LUM8_CORFA|nr:Cytochrome P450 [Cordyceps fumosorosea ARSEF 2679]OAA53526.1 Cytochrome P450 [Cordyceps fumosorosea ARSEF 2679]